MARRVTWLVIYGVLVGCSGCVFVSGTINPFAQKREGLRETEVSGTGRDKILLLDISSIITSTEKRRSLGLAREESTVARLQEALGEARDDGRIRAVVLRINSPGGGVTASDTIYREIMRFKAETKLPVKAALMDVATSGAYYIALAADEIIASPTAVTGSVGVILLGVNVQGLMAKLGIRDQTVKSGAHKDLLSPLRDTTAEERAIVQGVIDELHGRFLSLVSERRPNVTGAQLERLADGRIFAAQQALEIGLIDRIGYLDEAIDAAREAAGIEEARVIMYNRVHEYRENVYSQGNLVPSGDAHPVRGADILSFTLALPREEAPRFMYLWAPGVASYP